MTAYDDFIKGFTVLNKYENYGQVAKSADGYELLAGEAGPDRMTPEDFQVMMDAGWLWNELAGCWSHSID